MSRTISPSTTDRSLWAVLDDQGDVIADGFGSATAASNWIDDQSKVRARDAHGVDAWDLRRANPQTLTRFDADGARDSRPTRDDQLPGELDCDLEAARNAVGVIVEIPDQSGAIGVVVGCRALVDGHEDQWMVRDECGSWHECRAGYFRILGRVDADGAIAWEV